MIINTVKELENSYLVNGVSTIFKKYGATGYDKVQDWIAEGNTPDPEFTEAELLQNAKDGKIKELEIFHESDSARILTINNTFQVSTNFESTRKWFNEIISDLKNEAYVTSASYTAVKFDWEISTGVWLPLNLEQLCQFKYAVFNITKTNFKQYRTHIKAIEALSSVEDVNSYDFTQGYLLDNQLTFDLWATTL